MSDFLCYFRKIYTACFCIVLRQKTILFQQQHPIFPRLQCFYSIFPWDSPFFYCFLSIMQEPNNPYPRKHPRETKQYRTIEEALGDNFACAQLPSFQAGDYEGTMKSYAGSKAIGVNPTCENMDVAVALAVYLEIGRASCRERV